MGTPNLNLDHIATNQASPEVTANAIFDGLDNAMNAQLSISNADADLTLSASQFKGSVSFIITSANTGNHNVVVPATKRLFFAQNGTSGGHSLTFKTSGGTGITLAASDGNVLLYGDGTNVVAVAKLVGTASGTVAAGDDSRITGAQQASGRNVAGATGYPGFVAAPGAHNSTGTAGSFAVDASNFYICYATNSWVRVSTGGTFSTSF